MASQGQLPPGATAAINGPPYPPSHQGLGGDPEILPDVPVNAVFLALFVFAAAAHMTLFQINMHKRGKKFVFNAAIFGYCITRILATSLRIGWAYRPRNVSLAMAAQIFVYAGVPILFVTNLFFAQRIVRAQHPNFGWSRLFSIWLPLTIGLMVVTIFGLITVVVLQFYLPDQTTQDWTRDFQLYGAVMFAFFAVLPIPIVVASWIARQVPSVRKSKTDNFGKGSTTSKIIIVIISAIPLALGAWYRAATSLIAPVGLQEQTPWYFSKACFYIFNFTMEIIVILFWLLIRIDQRFIVPNGADRPMSYAGGFVFAGEYPNKSSDHLNNPNGSVYKHRASTRTSLASTIIPPPALSRAGSWGSLEEYMTPAVTTKRSTQSLWGGISTDRVDSTVDEGYHSRHSTDRSSSEPQRPPPVRSEHGQLSQEMGYNPTTGRWDVREWQMMGPSVYDRDASPVREMPSIFSPSAEHIPSSSQPLPPRVYEPSGHPSARPSMVSMRVFGDEGESRRSESWGADHAV
ncbi:hypothetical protein CLAFUW4_12343 [Fulvia fulva]|uniref:Uncharacterized protein n=1 Tax=Passalora fulva TaxID=5499 RepID=A0A9Q8PDP6_PASFU|nr:uncharacterized protein CLAFUR5_11373 [Fulvia fulva]KAK4618167.1 hypothetical protein CLAFUR4_12348 [Fulvia fulva]KAK4618850.1 hypothetical protein CLAFUR0_12359 [Fulvia fulva]UJO20536.1 hypothetical protein CLAFUR5_11373 [Fulvia fulva]WPV18354.1 hypothetical protein CLAFUW4_12343 [Fulvia fulva]WPV33148.1 hypothetical protein CLAFUW7_12350 [Fulvia fulva]